MKCVVTRSELKNNRGGKKTKKRNALSQVKHDFFYTSVCLLTIPLACAGIAHLS